MQEKYTPTAERARAWPSDLPCWDEQQRIRELTHSCNSAECDATVQLSSYRARIRPFNQACEMDPALDSFIQLKARNAEAAIRSARLVADDKVIVLDVERIDG